MATGYEQIRPIKGIYQSSGDVILAEFTDDDFISIINGGTGGTSKAGARTSLELIQYTEYNTFSEFESPTTSRLSLNNQDGKLYYSYNNTWKEIANLTKSKYYTAEGFDDVESFIFNNRFITSYDGGTLTLDIDVVDITDRLDVIEGDVDITGSILNTVQDNIDLLLDGVIPELDTLKEIATSLGDAVDIKNQLDIVSNDLSTEITNRTDADTVLTTNLTTETTDRTDADTVLTASIAAEVTNRIDADTVLTASIAAEVTNRTDADTVLTASIAAEVTNRTDANTLLTTSIATEVTNRTTADTLLTTNLATEVTDRTTADTLLTTNLATEVTNRTDADILLTTNLATEVTDRTDADTVITDNVVVITDRLNVIEGGVSTTGSILNTVQDNIDLLLDGVIPELDTLKEIATSLGDTVDFKSQYDITVSDLSSLSTKVDDIDDQLTSSEQLISTVIDSLNSLSGSVSPELNTLQKIAESLGNSVNIKDQLDIVSTNLATEVTDRTAADTLLTTNLATEVTDRTAGDTLLTTNLATEVTDRTAADTVLTTNLATEVTDRTAADTVLTTNLATEVTDRTAADTLLTTNLATEVTDRTAADTVLTTNLATEVTDRTDANALITTSIATEVTDRIAGDTILTTNLATEVTNRTDADTVLTTNLATEVSDRIAADTVLTTNLATEVTDRTDDVNNILSILNNFSYDGHDNNIINDTHPTGLMLDKQTGKYKPSLLNMGHFIPFKRENNDVDDVNLITTFDGNVLLSSTLRFWKHNGEQDNISFIIV
jgi:hypothetical protein